MYPHFDYVEDKWLAKKVYNKLSIRYVVAFSCIAIMIITTQLIARRLMNRQLTDSRVINVAGRQRMLSQKLTKEILLYYHSINSIKRKEILTKLDSTYQVWKQAHQSLQNGDTRIGLPGNNSDIIISLFDSIQPHFSIISDNYSLLKHSATTKSQENNKEIKKYVDQILEHEQSFLSGMNEIVYQYDIEAKDKVSSLIQLETTLLFIGLAVLIFEVAFIFWPTAGYTKTIVNELIESEEKQKKLKEKLLHKKAEEQKIRASMLFEGQERERRRIARDLHDGIGQLLTGLKFQIEAMDTDDPDSIIFQVGKLKGFAADIIKEIRRVSFDLRPSVLSDYGLTSAIRNITQELNKLTNIKIRFENRTGFDIRLEKKQETHLFRIIQESINNALKYSEAQNITINLTHNKEFLEIVVEDDGIGFELEKARKKDYELRKGRGLFNMFERSDFLNAELNIESKLRAGTKIRIKLPLIKELI